MSKLVALRVPDDVLASIDVMAKAEGLNRSQAIIALLRDSDLPVGSGVVAVVPVVTESPVVAPVVESAVVVAKTLVTPKKDPVIREDRPAARFSGCAKCGALGGMHQKGCGK